MNKQQGTKIIKQKVSRPSKVLNHQLDSIQWNPLL